MPEKAKGLEGFLLIYPDFSTAVPAGKKMVGGKMIETTKCNNIILAFRVYEYDVNGNHKRKENGGVIFKDYEIRHHDLKVKLLDGMLYETEEGNYIDYE